MKENIFSRTFFESLQLLQQVHSMFLGFNGFGLQVWEKVIFSMWVLRIKTKEVKKKWATQFVFENLNLWAQQISWSYQSGFSWPLALLSQCSKISKFLCPRHNPYTTCLSSSQTTQLLHTLKNPEIFQFLQHYHYISPDL